TWIDRVRQPRVRRPCPPKRGQEQERVLEAAPGRIAGQHRCDLRERKDEDEVEKELERRDPLLALDGLRVHERTLTRFASCVRPRSGYRVPPRELVPAVLLDDLVHGVRARPVLAPIVAVVDHVLACLDQPGARRRTRRPYLLT